MSKRILAMLLCLCLLAAYLPAEAPARAYDYDSVGLYYQYLYQEDGVWKAYEDCYPAEGATIYGAVPGQGGFNPLRLIYVLDADADQAVALTAADLSVPEEVDVNTLSNADGTSDPTYLGFSAAQFGDFDIYYQINGQPVGDPLRFLVELPYAGFYCAPEAKEEYFLSQWDLEDDNSPVYLVLREGWTINSLQEMSGSTIEYTIAPDNTSAEIFLKNLAWEQLSIQVDCNDQWGVTQLYADIRVNDLRPQLYWRYANWDQATESYVSDPSGNLNTNSGVYSPGSNAFIDFVYDDRSGTQTTVSYDDLTFTGDCAEAAPEGDVIRLTFTGFGDFTVSYQGASRTFHSGLPTIGFYDAPEAAEESFVTMWDWAGPNSSLYLIARNGWTISSVEPNGRTSSFTYSLSQDGTSAELHISEIVNNRLSVKVNISNDGGYNSEFYEQVQISDARPGLVARHASYSAEQGYYSDPTTPLEQVSLSDSVLYTGQFYDFYLRDEEGNLTPVAPGEFTKTGDCFSLSNYDGFTYLYFNAPGEGELIYGDYVIPVSVGLNKVNAYSVSTASMENFVKNWSWTGPDDILYLVPQEGVTLSAVEETSGNGAVIHVVGGGSYATVQLPQVSNTWLQLRCLDADGRQLNWVTLNVKDVQAGLYLRYMNWDGEKQQYVSDPGGYLNKSISAQPGTNHNVEFLWRDANGSLTALSLVQLAVAGKVFALEEDRGSIRMTVTGFGGGAVSYNGASVTVNGVLPDIGFYSSPEATEADYLFQWDWAGPDSLIYLVSRNGFTIDELESRNSNEICYNLSQDHSSAEIQVKDLTDDYLRLKVNNGRFEDIRINDVQPGLCMRHMKWDQQNNQWVPNPDGEFERELTTTYGNNIFEEFLWRDANGSLTALTLSQLTTDGNVFALYEEQGAIRVQMKVVGSGSIQYEAPDGKTYSIPIHVELPYLGFYSKPEAKEEYLLTRWDWTGEDSAVYLVTRENSAIDTVVPNGNSMAFTYDVLADGRYAKVKTTVVDNSWLSVRVDYEDGGWRYASIQVNDVRPGLYYTWPVWDNDKQRYVPHELNELTAQNVYNYSITGSPNNRNYREFFWRDGDGKLTRLTAAELSVSGAVALSDDNGLVRIDYTSFGTGSIGYNGTFIPVNVVVPEEGFFSAPARTEENYLSTGNGYEGEARTVYYLTATPGDLVIDSVQSTNANITAAVGEGGKYIRIDPPQSFTGGVGGQITYTGTSQHITGGVVNGTVYVNFFAKALLVEPVLEPSTEITFGDSYSGIGRGVGQTAYIRPVLRTGSGWEVFTGDLSSQDPSIVQVSQYDASAHTWALTFVGEGKTWILGTQDGTVYCIAVHPAGNPGNLPGEQMYFNLAYLPHSDYRTEEGQYIGFSVDKGESRLFRFVDEMGRLVTSGLTYDTSALAVEAFENPDLAGVYKVTGLKSGEYTISSDGASVEAYVNSRRLALTEVPAVAATYTAAGNLAYFTDGDGNLYVLPEYPYTAEEVLTRAKLSQFICDAFGFTGHTIENPYTDVASDIPEYDAILTLTEKKILTGVGEGLFAPDDTATRAQMAVILMRCIGGNVGGAAALPKDVPDHTWYAEAVMFCLNAGLMRVDGDGNFGPQETVKFGDIDPVALLSWSGNKRVSLEDVTIPALVQGPAAVLSLDTVETDTGRVWQASVYFRPEGEEEEETVSAYGARYDAEGRFLGVTVLKLKPGEVNTVVIPFENGETVKIFALGDESHAPVCAAMSSEPGA